MDEQLTDTERQALHELQLGVEHTHRGFGALLEFHHEIGNATDHLEEARRLLAEAGHDEHADALRDDLLPAGVFADKWTFELVEAFQEGFLADVSDFDTAIRADLADGRAHVAERDQQRAWMDRVEDGE